MENWLPIEGYEGIYEVSDRGRIRSLDRIVLRSSRSGNIYPWTRPGCIMRQYRQPEAIKQYRRYWQIQLTNSDSVKRHHHVHLLVAFAFLGPCPDEEQVRHGPAGMLDNSVSNLSYGTPADQQADRIRDGTSNRGSRNGQAKLTESDVRDIRIRYESGTRQKDIAAEFRCSTATISMIINRKSWGWL